MRPPGNALPKNLSLKRLPAETDASKFHEKRYRTKKKKKKKDQNRARSEHRVSTGQLHTEEERAQMELANRDIKATDTASPRKRKGEIRNMSH